MRDVERTVGAVCVGVGSGLVAGEVGWGFEGAIGLVLIVGALHSAIWGRD